jgi:hypothetical protein
MAMRATFGATFIVDFLLLRRHRDRIERKCFRDKVGINNVAQCSGEERVPMNTIVVWSTAAANMYVLSSVTAQGCDASDREMYRKKGEI